jgi:hypothetical protein
MADDHDPYGTNHPGAIAVLAVSTLATFGSMYWLHRQNDKAHASLQEQLAQLNDAFLEHIQDSTRHLTP